jgi:serine/threonine protein kinase
MENGQRSAASQQLTLEEFGSIIGRRYQVLTKLGEGKFGILYQGRNVATNQSVAIKTESSGSPIRLLKNETTILKYLYDQGCRCVPIVYWYGVHIDTTCLVFSCYTVSLYDYFHIGPIDSEKRKSIMRTCIEMVESIHQHFVIHRDIKPHNFMIRDGELFLIDFGLATFYIDSCGKHIDDVMSEDLTGTPRYMSYNVHCGHRASRRDDLVSLGYIYLWMINGELPWNTFVTNNKSKSWNILENLVLDTDAKLHRYLEYCYRLSYEGSPLYGELIKIFT